MIVDGRMGQDEPSPAEVARARWRRWALGLVIVVVAGVGGVLIAPVLPSPDSGGPTPAQREQVSAVLSVIGIVLIAVALVLAARKGMYNGRFAARMRTFSLAQRRQARRCVRRGQRAPQELGALAVFIAEALVRQRYMLLVLAGIVANTLSTAVRATNPGWLLFEAALVVAMVVVSITTLVTAHAAQRWLQTYAPASPDHNLA